MTLRPGDAIKVVLSVTDPGRLFWPLDELLWQERRLLERLNYRLVAQHATIASGDARWLHVSDVEVTTALRELHQHEALRAAETEHVLGQLGLRSGTTLRQLAAAAPTPWSLMFTDHWDAMCTIEHEIRTVADRTASLLESRQDADPDSHNPGGES